MKVRAIFIGANSLGYEHGKEYDLILGEAAFNQLIIKEIHGKGEYCLYANLFKLLENWKNVTLIK